MVLNINDRRSSVEDEECDHIQILRAFVEHLVLQQLDLHPPRIVRVELRHRHVCEIFSQLGLFMVEKFMEAVADHQRNLVFGEIPLIERTDAFEDG